MQDFSEQIHHRQVQLRDKCRHDDLQTVRFILTAISHWFSVVSTWVEVQWVSCLLWIRNEKNSCKESLQTCSQFSITMNIWLVSADWCPQTMYHLHVLILEPAKTSSISSWTSSNISQPAASSALVSFNADLQKDVILALYCRPPYTRYLVLKMLHE